MQLHFGNAEDRERWAWTEGLHTLGQQEIAVIVPWPEHDQREKLVIDLLRFLGNYLSSQPERILPGQTLRYGWTTLRFVEDEQNRSGAGKDVLLVEEMQRPFFSEKQSYLPGVAQTLTLLQLQHEAIQRNRITGDVIYPHGSQRAMVCTRVTPKTVQRLRPLRADRAWQPDVRDSGWFIGCCDEDHDHDNANELATMHLFHLVDQFPGLFPYLGMPVGTMMVFEESQAIIFPPDEQEGRDDPGKLLSSLL